MNFSEFFDSTKERFDSLIESFTDFFNENKKICIIVASLLSLVLICVILLIITLSKSKKEEPVIQDPLILSETLVIPASPELPKEYTLSRKTKDKWSEEDASLWFTVPSEKEIESLSKTNENMVNEIIGAAP